MSDFFDIKGLEIIFNTQKIKDYSNIMRVTIDDLVIYEGEIIYNFFLDKKYVQKYVRLFILIKEEWIQVEKKIFKRKVSIRNINRYLDDFNKKIKDVIDSEY